MQLWQAGLVFLAGTGAGAINAAVGSGTLITFPTLVALGYPPVVANISNNLGLVPGSLTGAWGYRAELRGQAVVLRRLVPCSLAGGVLGAVLLLVLPSGAFTAIVPMLIAVALVLVVAQPWLAARVRGPAEPPGAGDGGDGGDGGDSGDGAVAVGRGRRVPWAGLSLGTFAAGVYGGYFGAAQGVLLIGLLGWLLTDSLQQANGIKNWLSAAVNAVASIIFIVAAPHQVNWVLVPLIAAGSTLGGVIGASVGRRLPAVMLRGLIVVVGCVAIVRLVFG